MITLKTEKQIEGIRKSAKILASLHRELNVVMKEGVTTKEIDKFCYDFIVGHNAKPAFLGYMDYPASSCISVNEEVIHGIPGKRVLCDGDIVSIDLGVVLDGYFSDAAQTIIIGNADMETTKLVQVTKQCLEAAIKAAETGKRISDISKAVYALAKKNGYGVVREYCGHGVGLALHEEPQISNYVSSGQNPRIRPGMVLAIEPMINMGSRKIIHLPDGWTVVTADSLPSAHWEHTIAVHKDHIEVLTAF
ncbi:MAG: type I methionyl aminopeptidase [Bacteroidetes bacterium]|nr:type I methionyl aminopeptidase [Bacteroidota bacterium]